MTTKKRREEKTEKVRDRGVELRDTLAIRTTGEDRANRSTEDFNKNEQVLYNAVERTGDSQQEG